MLYNDKNNSKIQLIYYNNNKNSFSIRKQINFPEKIYSLNFSPDKEKIYVCLEDKKSIKFINYNSINNNLELSEEKIEINSNEHFKKCIYINDNCLLTIDKLIIYLWLKEEFNPNKYLNINKIKLNEELYDICLINDDNLIFSQKLKIIFLNLKNFSVEKIIDKIDPINEKNSLISIKDYILVNCEKGIAIISTKTKEMIQYIEWNIKKKNLNYLMKIYILFHMMLLYINIVLLNKILDCHQNMKLKDLILILIYLIFL